MVYNMLYSQHHQKQIFVLENFGEPSLHFREILCTFSTVADDGKSYGMYLKAFTHGVEKELIPYHRDIIDLQEKALLNPSMTISELQCFITKHYNPLKSYCALINQVIV